MFHGYLLPVKAALLAYPLLAAAVVVPASVVAYRRRGRAGGWAAFVFYTFVFYLLAAFLQTVIPLPADPTAVCASPSYASSPQLAPFHFVGDIGRNGVRALVPTLLNVALLLPLGVYLRYLFRLGLLATGLIAFATSLFFEITQLTGLWFAYPCPYRQFNVDDLICNTGGALLGWIFIAPLTRLLPRIDPAGERARYAARVTFPRRAFAYGLDLLGWLVAFTLVIGVLVLAGVAVPDAVSMLIGAGVGLAWFWAVPVLTGGSTLGKRLLLLRVVQPGGERADAAALLLRYGILLGPLWLGWLQLWLAADGEGARESWIAALILLAAIVSWVWSPLAVLIRRDHRAPYEQASGTVNAAILRDADASGEPATP